MLELELPGLGDERFSEALVLLAADPPEALGTVDRACRIEMALRPQHDLAVADTAREGDAGAGEAPAQPGAAGNRIDNEQAQFRRLPVFRDEKYRSHHPAVSLRDPAALA